MFEKRLHYRILFLLCLFLLLSISNYAQYYSAGQNAASVKWKILKTEHFKILFAEGFEQTGQYAANYLETAYGIAGESLKHKPARITIVLQPDNANYNGFVTWAPKRSEMYMVPPQDNDQANWLDNLLVHEYRHVVQIDKLNTGLTKVLYWLLGQQGIGLVFGLTTPLWFVEGDAVHTETMYTSGGRGRVPDFNLKLRTQLLYYGPYSYEKASFGSYKDIVADHYTLGYYLTDYARFQYGQDVWAGVLKRVGTFPFKPFRFSNAIKKETGLKSIQLYDSSMTFIESHWDETSDFSEKENRNQKKAVPVHYRHPVFRNGKIYSFKQGLGNPGELVAVDTSVHKEVHILYTGAFQNDRLSANDSFMVWAETYKHVRWGQKSFSNIVVYDFQAEKRTQITSGQYFYSPFVHPEKNRIVCVQNEKIKTRLAILDLNGSLLDTVANGEDLGLFKQPVFVSDSQVAVINFYAEKEHLEIYNLQDKTKEVVYESPFETYGLSYEDGQLAFRSRNSVKDQILKFGLKEKEITVLTDSDFGASDPYIQDSVLYYAEYTPKGYKLAVTSLNSEKKIEAGDSLRMLFVEQVVERDSITPIKDTLQDSSYRVKKYSKALHLFNFHSWQPFAFDPLNNRLTTPEIGFSLLSQNMLSTSFLTVGASLNPTASTESYYGSYSYRGFFPALSVGYNYTVEKNLDIRTVIEEDTLKLNARREENKLNFAVSVPLSWYKNAYVYAQETGISFPFTKSDILASEENGGLEEGEVIRTNAFLPGHVYTYFSRAKRMSKRDIRPEFRQQVTAGYVESIYSENLDDNLWYASGLVSFPGVLKHHSLQLYAGHQKRLGVGTAFGNQIAYPRGYNAIRVRKATSLRVDYALPLFYPDWKIAFLAYIQRVKMNVFYDTGIFQTSTNKIDVRSYGVDLSADVNFLRYFFLWDIGARITYRDYDGSWRTSLLVSVDF